MRELTLTETGYLAGLLGLSLVLPVLMSFLIQGEGLRRRAGMKMVWLNQVMLALCGIMVLASARWAACVLCLALVSTAVCSRAVFKKQKAAIKNSHT